VAQEVKRSLAWVYKWQKRCFEASDWQALVDRSRAPKHMSKKLPVDICEEIRAVRKEQA